MSSSTPKSAPYFSAAWTQATASSRARRWLRGRLNPSRTWPPRSFLLPSTPCCPFFVFFFLFVMPECSHASSSSGVISDLLWCVLGVCRSMLYTLQCYITQVSNRRSRRWLNDRLLIELVPRLHVEEIKGLFAPPPWGMLRILLQYFFKKACFFYASQFKCSLTICTNCLRLPLVC